MQLTPEVIAALKAEKLRRQEGRAKRVIDDLHEAQKEVFVHNDSRFTCYACHRRWGKTEGFLRYAGYKAQITKRYVATVLYQELRYAKTVSWPIIEELADEYDWEIESRNRNEGYIRFKGTGGTIQLLGADNESRHRILRGPKPDDVLIDEAQDWHSDLKSLINEGIRASLADKRGRLFMCGTPPKGAIDFENNYFLQVCRGDHPQWKVRRNPVVANPKTAQDLIFENPHTEKELRQDIVDGLSVNPNFLNLPWVQREYMGLFVVDARKNVIHVDPAINYLTEWEREKDDQFIISIDWGDEVAAIAVATFNTRRYPYLIYLEAHALKGLLINDHVVFIRSLLDRYPNAVVIGDPGGVSKSIVRELREVHRLPIINAQKDDRTAQIELMNSDLSMGLVRLYHLNDPRNPAAHPLAQQWRELVWLENRARGTREESRPRDIHDAALYARRYAHGYLHAPEQDKPRPGTPEYRQMMSMELRKKKEANLRASRRKY